MGRIVSLDEATVAVAAARERGETVVLANGGFDMLHVGHVRYLQGARAEGDRLLVAVNTDESVRRAKGAERPLVPQQERAELVAALSGVDWVLLFSEDTPEQVIARLKPDVQAKGTDYTEASVPEGDLVRSYGGRVAIVGDPKDHSTTEMLRTLRGSSD